MLMVLIALGRIAMFKQTDDILFIVCEGEMVKFASAADYELEERKKKILKNNHVHMLSLHRFQQDLICQTFISGSPHSSREKGL